MTYRDPPIWIPAHDRAFVEAPCSSFDTDQFRRYTYGEPTERDLARFDEVYTCEYCGGDCHLPICDDCFRELGEGE